MSRGELPVLIKEELFSGSIADAGIFHVKEIIHGNIQCSADIRKQVDVGAASAVFPVADGVSGNVDQFREHLLLHTRSFTVETDSFAQDGQGGSFHRFSCFHVDDIACPLGGTFYTSPRHIVCSFPIGDTDLMIE